MNVNIQPHRVKLTDALRADIEHAARETLDVLDAPLTTPISATLRGPAEAGSQRYHAEATVELPEGKLRAEGNGPGAAEAFAALRGALVRRAHQWQIRHAARQERSDASLLKGEPVSEGALRDARRFGEAGEDYNRETDHRPPGDR